MNTVKMTNQEIINHINQIGEIIAVRLPAKASYALNKNRKTFIKEYDCYFEEFTKLQEEYPEGGDAYQKELIDLLSIENDVSIHSVPETILETATHDLSLEVFQALEFMLEEV
ncbi:hypothetical protein [Eubacterium callanderi]|uniref:hypothetical protein n=1 Tax=Eubacterium callanderi TaxID=53442 RepID=UPI001DC6E2D1|nr:hypothetical protein [Eubacterium limosum]MBS5284686.1 hypothetical protein [Clostridiales bacterium]